jgi:excisionase family DNA binding protein
MAIPAEVMLTPTEAAELLGLSRPFVARLLERGDIPSEFLPESRHRRIHRADCTRAPCCGLGAAPPPGTAGRVGHKSVDLMRSYGCGLRARM